MVAARSRSSPSVLPVDEVTLVDGIPATTPNRTRFDLAAVLDRSALERAFEQADSLRITDSLSLAALLTRHPRRPGAAALRTILGRGVCGLPTRSELEDRFLAFLDAHGLPRPLSTQRDRARDRLLQAAGWRVVRITWGQLHHDEDRIFADLRELLGITPYPPGVR